MKKKCLKTVLLIWQIVWPILSYILLTIALIILTRNRMGSAWTHVLSAAIASPFLLYCYHRREQNGIPAKGKSWVYKHNKIQTALLIFILACAACILFNNLVELTNIADVSEGYEEVEKVLDSGSLWLQALSSGIAAPIVEELIFRGLGYARLRRAMSIVPAAIISALLFGITHGNLVQGLYGFAMGVLLALVFEHMGGIAAAIWFHITANLLIVVLSAGMDIFPAFFDSDYYLYAGIPVSALVLAGGLFVLYNKKNRIAKPL